MKKQLTDTEFHYPIRYRMSQTVRYCLAVITKQFSLFQYSATFHLSPYHGGRWNGSHRSRREVKHFSFSLLYVDNRFCEDFTVSENPKIINCSVHSRGQKYIRGRTRVYIPQPGRAGISFSVSRSGNAWSGRLCRPSVVSGGTVSSPGWLMLKGTSALAMRGQN